MAITLYRVPSGWVNVLRTIVCGAGGADSMGRSGTPAEPFVTPEWIFGTFLLNSGVKSASLNNLFIRILLGIAPEPSAKSGQKKAWYCNVAVNDGDGSILSYKLIDISSYISPINPALPIFSLIGTFYNLIINNAAGIVLL